MKTLDAALNRDIEITPAMISAGVKAACLFEPSQDDLEVIVHEIYRAMRTASLRLAEASQ